MKKNSPIKEQEIIYIASKESQGWFGSKRKFDIHTGLDLYVVDNASVHAIMDGEVVSIEKFTGEFAGTPWWNNTWSVLVYHEEIDRTVVYGEIEPKVQINQKVKSGNILGTVIPVLKKDKGKNPTTMLHLEVFEGLSKESAKVWGHDKEKQKGLLDPAEEPWLKELILKKN